MAQPITSQSVDELLQLAQDEGILSQSGFGALAAAAQAHAVSGLSSLGVAAKTYTSKRVLLLLLCIDDSSSIHFAGNTQNVRDAHNQILQAVKAAKESGDVLVYTCFINGTVINAFVPIEQAELLTDKNYNPHGGTPLYDSEANMQAMAIAKAAEFTQNQIGVQVMKMLITDGQDEGSRSYTRPEDVKPALLDMALSEDPAFINLAWGIDNGNVDYNDIFTQMGYRAEWIMRSGATDPEIRRAALLASSIAAGVSRTAASFSQAAASGLGGFVNP